MGEWIPMLGVDGDEDDDWGEDDDWDSENEQDDRVDGMETSPALPPLEGDGWDVGNGETIRGSVMRKYGAAAAALVGITDARYWINHEAFGSLDEMLAAAVHRDDPLPLPLPPLKGSTEDVQLAERYRAVVVAGGSLQAAWAAEKSEDRRSRIAGILAHDEAGWWGHRYSSGLGLVREALSPDADAV